jgi:hypothetical protein
MSKTNYVYPDLNEGKNKKTLVLPSHSSQFPFKTVAQSCYVSGMQVYDETKKIGLPNFLLSGVILCYQLPKIYHPILNHVLTITLYIYFDCATAQVRCFTVCFNTSNKIDIYSFINYLYVNKILTPPLRFNLPLPKGRAIILVPPRYFKSEVLDHIYPTKNTIYKINPFFWKDKRMPLAIKRLNTFIHGNEKNIVKAKNGEILFENIKKVLSCYNYETLKNLNKLNKVPNYSVEDGINLGMHLDWDNVKCSITE